MKCVRWHFNGMSDVQITVSSRQEASAAPTDSARGRLLSCPFLSGSSYCSSVKITLQGLKVFVT